MRKDHFAELADSPSSDVLSDYDDAKTIVSLHDTSSMASAPSELHVPSQALSKDPAHSISQCSIAESEELKSEMVSSSSMVSARSELELVSHDSSKDSIDSAPDVKSHYVYFVESEEHDSTTDLKSHYTYSVVSERQHSFNVSPHDDPSTGPGRSVYDYQVEEADSNDHQNTVAVEVQECDIASDSSTDQLGVQCGTIQVRLAPPDIQTVHGEYVENEITPWVCDELARAPPVCGEAAFPDMTPSPRDQMQCDVNDDHSDKGYELYDGLSDENLLAGGLSQFILGLIDNTGDRIQYGLTEDEVTPEMKRSPYYVPEGTLDAVMLDIITEAQWDIDSGRWHSRYTADGDLLTDDESKCYSGSLM